MINFIICDDEEKTLKKLSDYISKTMLSRKEEYKIHAFLKYDLSFLKIMNSDIGTKIYILDIEVGEMSGLDISRRIRQKDWNSIIILVSAYYELSYAAFRDRLLILDFVSKFDNLEAKFKESILLSMDILNSKEQLSFLSQNVMQKVYFKDILYITKDLENRKVLLYTKYDTFFINTTLLEIEQKLTSDFIKTHRACIVNIKNIKSIDYTKNKITFNDGNHTYLLSRSRKKEVKEACK
jgi:two-component system response regulator AgrA